MKKSIIKWGNQEASSDESEDDISIVNMHQYIKLLMPALDLLVEFHVSNFYIPNEKLHLFNGNLKYVTICNRNPDLENIFVAFYLEDKIQIDLV